MSVDRFELQQREYLEKGAYHFSDLSLETAEGIESIAKLELTLNTIGKFNPRLVIDFGCGEGVLVQALKLRSIACTGLDLSKSALNLAPESIKGSLVQAHLGKVPLRNNLADVVSIIAVLEHVPPSDIPDVLNEAKRVMQRSGRLIVRVPSQNQSLESKHYQHFTEASLRQILMSNGFLIKKIIGNHDTSQDWNSYYSHMDQDSDEIKYHAYQEIFAVCKPAKAKRLLAVCLNI